MDSSTFTRESTGQPEASTSSLSAAQSPAREPVKKKRKQNQACDACKARRVKCDLGELPWGSSCSKCLAKGIACTAIINAIRDPPQRTGIRIEHAKRLYGSIDGPSSDSSDGGGGGGRSSSPSSVVAFRHPPPPSSVYSTAPGKSLAHVTLSQALERDLLECYFRTAHFTVQAIDPFEFKQKYNEAGQLSQYMSPADQVRCAVMCCWGARYSLNPGVIPPGSANPPSEYTGRMREPVCDALLDRAQNMLDAHGLLRKPSTETVQTLLLLSPLIEYREDAEVARNGPNNLRSPQTAEVRLIEGIMAEHVDSLGMWDDSPVVGYDKALGPNGDHLVENNELTGLKILGQMRSQRLLWGAWIWDSFRSAAGRKPARFSDEVLFDICPHIPRLGDPLPNVLDLSDAQCFLLLISSYPMLAELLRFLAKNVTIPSVRKRNFQKVDELGRHSRTFWKAMDDFSVWFDQVAERILGQFPTLSTFSPISWYTAIKLAHTLTLLFCHRTIYERFETEVAKARASTPAAFFEAPSSEGSSPDSNKHTPPPKEKAKTELEAITLLHNDSMEVTLAAARSSARLVAKILDSQFMQSGGNELKELRIIACFLAELPVIEEGFEGKRRTSRDWTWSNKVQEVSWLMEGIRQVGFAWGACSLALGEVMNVMIRRTPAGFPPFTPCPTRPTPTSPNLGTDLTNLRYPDFSVTELKDALHEAVLPAGSDQSDDSRSEARWSTLSPDHTHGGARKGGIDLPKYDLTIGNGFNLNQDGDERNPFLTTASARTSMAEYIDDLLHRRAPADASGTTAGVPTPFLSDQQQPQPSPEVPSFADLFPPNPTLEDLPLPSPPPPPPPPPPQQQQQQQQPYPPSPFEFTVAGQAIQGFETEQIRAVFRSLEGNGLGFGENGGGIFGQAGGQSGFATQTSGEMGGGAGGGGGGMFDPDQDDPEAFERFLASFPVSSMPTMGADGSSGGWGTQ